MGLIRIVKGLIVRIKNSGYRLSENRLERQRLVMQLNTMPRYLLCPHCFQPISLAHFQPIAQHPEQETSKTKHEQHSECEDCLETKE